MVFVVKDITVIFRKIKTILILVSFKRYFSHPEKSILNLRLPKLLGGIVIPGPGRYFKTRIVSSNTIFGLSRLDGIIKDWDYSM